MKLFIYIHIDFGEGGGNPYFGGSEFIQNISGNRDNFFLFQGFQMRYTHGIWLYNIDLSTYALKGPHATYNFFPWFSYSQYTLIMMHC